MRDYLLNEGGFLKNADKNEVVRLVGGKNVSSETIAGIFEEMGRMQPTGKRRVETPVHHVSINPDLEDRKITDEEAWHILAELEKKYGYSRGTHQAIMVEHVLDGRQHFHVVWNRVNLNTRRGVWPGHHWKKSKLVAREIEKALGLRVSFAPSEWEVLHASQLGRSLDDIDKSLHKAFKAAKSGQEFIGLCAAAGFNLGKSMPNKKGRVVLLVKDSKGGVYRLTPTFMRVDVEFRKAQLDKLTKDVFDTLPVYKLHNPNRSSKWFKDYAGWLGDDVEVKPKKGKGEKGKGGSGGGGLAMSALKADQNGNRPIHASAKDSDNKGKGNIPERRQKKVWVGVERRQQGPK